MNELDMSAPSTELFPELKTAQPYNSYLDVNMDQLVTEPQNTGVIQQDVAGQQQLSDKEMNFRALREEAAKLKADSEYWRGQAEAYSRTAQAPVQQHQEEQKLDWDDSNDIRKAWESMRNDNQKLREELRDTLAAVQTKTQHQDWNNMVTEHVPQLTSKNPMFAEMIQKSSNPYEAAYLLAQLNAGSAQQQAQQVPFSGNAQRAIQNSQKPQTLASVGGGGSLSQADYYANMSDEDFAKVAGRNLANI